MVFNYKQLFMHLKNENFHVHSNNKVSIAVESREVLLDPSLFPDIIIIIIIIMMMMMIMMVIIIILEFAVASLRGGSSSAVSRSH